MLPQYRLEGGEDYGRFKGCHEDPRGRIRRQVREGCSVSAWSGRMSKRHMDGGERRGFWAGMPEMCVVWGTGFREDRARRQAALSSHTEPSSWYPKLPSTSLVKLWLNYWGSSHCPPVRLDFILWALISQPGIHVIVSSGLFFFFFFNTDKTYFKMKISEIRC